MAKSGIHLNPKHKGMLHREMGIKQGQPISTAKLKAAMKNATPSEAKRINFALNARKWNH